MRFLKRVLLILGWLLAGIVTLAVLLLGTTLFLNRHDQPPSAQVQQLRAAIKGRAVDDASNGFVYLLGMGVAPDQDVLSSGRARMDWLRRSFSGPRQASTPDPIQGEVDRNPLRSEATKALLAACRSAPANAECTLTWSNSDDTMRAWLGGEAWLLERYRGLLAYTQWRDPLFLRVDATFPDYAVALEGQQLWLAQAMQAASEGRADLVTAALEQDMQFWRRVLAAAESTVTKVVAVTALRKNLILGQQALLRLPAAGAPAAWSLPLSDAERSLRPCLVGEWSYADATYHDMEASGLRTPGQTTQGGFWAGLMLNLFQPQDSSNHQAAEYLAIAQTLDVPPERLEAAIVQVRKDRDEAAGTRLPPLRLYNPLGAILVAITGPDFSNYALRIADLEGLRRATRLATELRARKLPASEVAAALPQATLRNPYNGEAFGWDAASASIVFQGRQDGERARHLVPYQLIAKAAAP